MSNPDPRYPAERMRRFLQPRDDAAEVREEALRRRDATDAEMSRVSQELCLLAERILDTRPDRDRVLRDQVPPAPDYDEIIRRLRPAYRARRGTTRESDAFPC